MGGKNNIQQILFHIESTAKKFGVKNISLENYFPSISEYSLLLENHGFKVIYARLKDRPTLLQCKDGLRNWVKAFRTSVLERISTKHH